MAKPSPTTEKGTVPNRQFNADVRPREYLTPKEVEKIIEAARKRSRYPLRDTTIILLAYRHGLRPSEACALQWDQFDLTHATVHVSRIKNGRDSVHPLRGDELRALRKLRREYPHTPYLFLTERGAPMTPVGFRKMFARLGDASGFPFPIHPHMLRHATGYKLANDGHDTSALQIYLGHKYIQNTTVYTELSPSRFKDFWRELAPTGGRGGDEGGEALVTQLYVCKTCRSQDFKGRLDRCPGASFGRALKARVKARGLDREIAVTAVQCLGVCDRLCTMAFAGEGKFSYIIGDLDRVRDLDAAVDFARLYAASDDGIPPKSERPEAIQAGIVARLPSLGLEHPRITEIIAPSRFKNFWRD